MIEDEQMTRGDIGKANKAEIKEAMDDVLKKIFLKRSKTLHLYTFNAKEGCAVMTFLYMNLKKVYCGIPSFSNSI